jgi:hypothetical protein
MEILAPGGILAIHHAASAGHEDVVRLLAEQHASMVACVQNDGSQPLHQAVCWRRRARRIRSEFVAFEACEENTDMYIYEKSYM